MEGTVFQSSTFLNKDTDSRANERRANHLSKRGLTVRRFKFSSRKELRASIVSFSFLKDGPDYGQIVFFAQEGS